MPLAAIPGIVWGGIAAGAGGIAGSAISSRAAGKAADTQAAAAERAAAMQLMAEREALAEQRRQFDIQQANLLPWLTAGRGALGQLESYGPFQAPGADFEQDPGYQFRLAEGQKALERSAAARGGLLTTGTARQLTRFGQDYASNEYQNVYNRRLGEYQTRYNQLANLAGLGQSATQQANTLSANQGANIANILIGGADTRANLMQNAGAARASGYAASGNIWGQGLANMGNLPMTLWALRNLTTTPPILYGRTGG